MKRTIKSLKEELRKHKQKHSFDYSMRNIYKEFPEWVEADEELRIAQNKRNEIEQKLRTEAQARQKKYNEKTIELENQIEQLQARNKEKFPTEILKWLDTKYTRGSSYGYGKRGKLKLAWLSDDQKYGIVTATGGTTWAGIGLTSYSPARHWAIEIYGPANNGITKYGDDRFEGRLTKEMKQLLIDELYKNLKNKNHSS